MFSRIWTRNHVSLLGLASEVSTSAMQGTDEQFLLGKRGWSWHISGVITKAVLKGKYEVEFFVHIFDNCTQNSFAVLSIIEHLLNKVEKEYPEVIHAYFRSDNAGCYHNGLLLLSLKEVGEGTGVRPVRYDFSEPRGGKDICDRKTNCFNEGAYKTVG